MRRALAWAVLALALYLPLRALFARAAAPANIADLVYEQPLEAAQVAAARGQESAGHAGTLTAAFWRQANVTLAGTAAQAIIYDGEAAVCHPAVYVSGGAPGAGDDRGCALSTALAWRLFGSDAVPGQTIRLGGRTLTVRGVFEEAAALLLCPAAPEETGSAYRYVALYGQTEDPQSAVADWLAATGLPAPDRIRYNAQRAWLAGAVAWLPLLLAALLLLVALWRAAARRPPPWRTLLRLGLVLAAAAALPALLGRLPRWLLPARWSDVGFWPQLFHTLYP